MAWYPAYRIPDAPLNGRFLTFHYVSPQLQAPNCGATASEGAISGPFENQALDPGHRQQQHNGAYSLELPISGLKLCNLHGERWFEPLSLDNVPTRSSQRNDAASNRAMPRNVQYTLSVLQRTAQYMARGTGMRLVTPKGAERLQQRHPDFEFFHTRH